MLFFLFHCCLRRHCRVFAGEREISSFSIDVYWRKGDSNCYGVSMQWCRDTFRVEEDANGKQMPPAFARLFFSLALCLVSNQMISFLLFFVKTYELWHKAIDWVQIWNVFFSVSNRYSVWVCREKKILSRLRKMCAKYQKWWKSRKSNWIQRIVDLRFEKRTFLVLSVMIKQVLSFEIEFPFLCNIFG